MGKLKVKNICISKDSLWHIRDVTHLTGLTTPEVVALCVLAQVKTGGDLTILDGIPRHDQTSATMDVTPRQYELIKEAAKSYGMTVSKFARLSIGEWLPQKDKREIDSLILLFSNQFEYFSREARIEAKQAQLNKIETTLEDIKAALSEWDANKKPFYLEGIKKLRGLTDDL